MIRERIQRICGALEKVLEIVVAVLCLVLLLALFVQVLNRYVFSISWPALQFIIPFCFLWICMICAALAVKRNEHFEVDLMVKIFKGGAQRIYTVIMSLLTVLGGGILFWSSFAFVRLGLLKKNPATGISMIYIYLSVLLGAMLIIIMALDRLITHLSLGKKGASHDAS